MIDLSRLRQDPETIKTLILRKEPGFAIDSLIDLDQRVRSIRSDVEQLRKEKNELAKQGAGGVTAQVRERAIQLGKDLKTKEQDLEVAEKEFNHLWLSCPNIPQDDIPVGDKADNKVVKTFGQKPVFSFTPKNHVELNEQAQWFDLQVGAAIAGSQFVFYNEFGTKIIYALTSLMLRNNVKHGFKPVLPPALIQEKGLYNAGNLPKFEGDFYKVNDENLCLIPTSEVSLTNLHADQIIAGDQLPLRYTAWTSCFRREAGSHGANDRGLIRIHQFEKVELFAITKPEDSNNELDRMVAAAEDILQSLGLHYRITLLAAQDCSFQSAKTFDIEVWLPGQDRFYEVSSCSNCQDFQARRASIRYRTKPEEKPCLVHTLNASSLALPRLMVALMETYQQEDGSIKLPEHVQKLIDNVW
ncbi:serine--tRNA ligase [bacterium]|nr:MAG: serine--tRNA ligase [bacterium]